MSSTMKMSATDLRIMRNALYDYVCKLHDTHELPRGVRELWPDVVKLQRRVDKSIERGWRTCTHCGVIDDDDGFPDADSTLCNVCDDPANRGDVA